MKNSKRSRTSGFREKSPSPGAWVLGLLLGSLILNDSVSAQAQYRGASLRFLTLADTKTFLQTGPTNLQFQEGSLIVNVQDGTFTIVGCIGNGGTSIMTPNMFCPLGTTAFIVAGDADGDGFADVRSFWSITNLIPAQFIAPGFANDPGGIRLSATPAASTLRNKVVPGIDTSIVLDYNMLDIGNIQEYKTTGYRFRKDYGPAQLGLMYTDLPAGDFYQFELPNLLNPGIPDQIRVTKQTFVEGWPGPTPVAGLGAFRVTNPFVNGSLEFDPRFQVAFNWTGISFGSGSQSATVNVSDRLYFSLRDAATDRIIYPLFPDETPDSDRAPIWLQNLLTAGGFSIGPFFQLGIFEPGTEVIAQLEVRRGIPTGSSVNYPIVAWDYSERIFRWPVRFIDTYEGYSVTAFPPGTPDAEIAPGFDFDGDGFTNFQEFALMTDPARPEDNPSQFILPEVVEGFVSLVIPKRRFTGGRIDYLGEVSTNGGQSWKRVGPSTPNWEITTDNEQVLEIRSTIPLSENPGRIRAAVRKLN